MATHRGITIFQVISPLRAFDLGESSSGGMKIRIVAHQQHSPEPVYEPKRGTALLNEPFSVAFALQTFLPLLTILVGNSIVSSEKVLGIYPILYQSMLRPEGLRWGKTGSIFILLTIVCSPIAGLLAASIAEAWRVGIRLDVLMRSIGELMFLGLYVGGWVFLTVAVAFRSRTSLRSLTILLTAWMFFTLIVPRLAGDIARSYVPLPSKEAIRQQKEQALHELKSKGMTVSETQANEVFDRIDSDYHLAQQLRHSTFRRFAIASPYLALRKLSAILAATDNESQQHFLESAEGYRRNLVETMNAAEKLGEKPGETFIERTRFWGRVPEYSYSFPSVFQRGGEMTGCSIILWIWFLVTGAMMLSVRLVPAIGEQSCS